MWANSDKLDKLIYEDCLIELCALRSLMIFIRTEGQQWLWTISLSSYLMLGDHWLASDYSPTMC